jgi:hypothetical protein
MPAQVAVLKTADVEFAAFEGLEELAVLRVEHIEASIATRAFLDGAVD